MIELIDFLKMAGVGVDETSTKVHLASGAGNDHPIDAFFAGQFKEWQEWQSRRNFQCNQVVSLIDRGQGSWLFVGVYKILDCMDLPEGDHTYSTELLPNQDHLIGRIIINYKRGGQQSYIWYKKDSVAKISLPIAEIFRKKMTIGEFPGYNAVKISFEQLKIIRDQKVESWYGALANIKGVYLILDTKTGKHYVGKASGDEGIWQRWCNYADNGHGGNKTLKRLIRDRGHGYMKNFQYSILEIADTHASDDDILRRESYWIDTLGTRKFGLNN